MVVVCLKTSQSCLMMKIWKCRKMSKTYWMPHRGILSRWLAERRLNMGWAIKDKRAKAAFMATRLSYSLTKCLSLKSWPTYRIDSVVCHQDRPYHRIVVGL
jgi:hypothetical protein